MTKTNLIDLAKTSMWKSQIDNLVKELSTDDQLHIKQILYSYENKLNSSITDINTVEKPIQYCLRCHRRIYNTHSIINGMGKVCYIKWLNEQHPPHNKNLF